MLGQPVPTVYAWNASSDNKVGAEYIIMKKARGALLKTVWSDMTNVQKRDLIRQIVLIEDKQINNRFPGSGCIYRASDMASAGVRSLSTQYPGFVLGPSVSQDFHKDGKTDVKTDRGPCKFLLSSPCSLAVTDPVGNTTTEWILGQIQREEECIRQHIKPPMPEGIFGRPPFYQPSESEKLAVIADFRKVADVLIPEHIFYCWPVLWHPDLHAGNIFVDPQNPARIMSIIDWQGAHVAPFFTQVTTPKFLHYDGPKPRPGFFPPLLPENFNELSPEEQREKRQLLVLQTLYREYELESRSNNWRTYQTSRYASSIDNDLMAFTCHVTRDMEPLIRSMLVGLARRWEDEHRTPCPISGTDEEKAASDAELKKWELGFEAKEEILRRLGVRTGWSGKVKDTEYDQMKEKLEAAREEFLDKMTADILENQVEEREKWAKVWPFQDR